MKFTITIQALKKFSWLFVGFTNPKVEKTSLVRKLSCFADKEGKTRVIAIGDYFSQTVLKGLHNYLYKVLKKIPQDCTFDQGKFRDKIRD